MDPATLPPPFIPDEIISEILCLLPVKTILLLKCVSKTWKTLISDPSFGQKHFQKSPQNPQLLYISDDPFSISSVKSVPMIHFDETAPWIIVSIKKFYGWMDNCRVVGSCKGLLCLLFRYNQIYWFCLWNPVTNTLSEKLGISHDQESLYKSCRFTFGCDISTGTYKVVALSKVFREENTFSMRYEFRLGVLSLGDNYWRTFQFGSSIPACLYGDATRVNNGLHLNGTVNWLALTKYVKQTYYYNWNTIANAQQFVIVSFDLSTETCTQFLLPPGFDDVPFLQPTLSVLMDCLCFLHDLKGSEFVIWHMKEFGVQKSWTLLFKIKCIDIQMHYYPSSRRSTYLVPLYLSKNGDTCILANYDDGQVVIYNQREKRGRRIRLADKMCLFSAMEYVESIVSTCRESWRGRAFSIGG